MKTKMTELFGIEHPIMCGGMLWVTDPKLCAAVSNAGGLGCITADQFDNGEQLRESIREVKALTDKPFGVNITLMPSFRLTDAIFLEFFKTCCEEKVANIEISGRFATEVIPMVHKAGVRITHKVGAVRHAVKVEKLGYDAVIVAGVEEGGHPLKDNVATTVLLPKVCESVNFPVIATGGMVDGKSVAAALCLGADGVMMGTRFMLSTEAWYHDNVKNWLLNVDETGTELFCKTTLQARAAVNAAVKKVDELEAAGAGVAEMGDVIAGWRLRKALTEGDVDGAAFFVGQSVGRISELQSCKEIIDEIMSGCRDTLRETAAKYAV